MALVGLEMHIEVLEEDNGNSSILEHLPQVLVQTLAEAFAGRLFFIFECGVIEGLECVINSGDDDRAKDLLPFRSPFFSEVFVFIYVDLELVPELSLNIR